MNILNFFMSLKNSNSFLILLNSNVLFIASDVLINSISDVLFNMSHVSGIHLGNVLSLNKIGLIWSNCVKHFTI
jgi:hypothetical protein